MTVQYKYMDTLVTLMDEVKIITHLNCGLKSTFWNLIRFLPR